MKKHLILFVLLTLSINVHANEKSYLYPKFKELFESYIENSGENGTYHAATQLLSDQKIKRSLISRLLKKFKKKEILLEAKENIPKFQFQFQIRFDLLSLHVKEEFDDFFNDNIFVYMYITIDQYTFSKVTKIYKGLDEGDRIFFDSIDRAIYPYAGITGNSLVIDYGVVESDHEDISELKKLSAIIVDLAYKLATGNTSIDIRREVKAFAGFLFSLDLSDKLAIRSIMLTPSMINSLPYVFNQRLKGNRNFSDWEYILSFRALGLSER
jgi:hypothetical protein